MSAKEEATNFASDPRSLTPFSAFVKRLDIQDISAVSKTSVRPENLALVLERAAHKAERFVTYLGMGRAENFDPGFIEQVGFFEVLSSIRGKGITEALMRVAKETGYTGELDKGEKSPAFHLMRKGEESYTEYHVLDDGEMRQIGTDAIWKLALGKQVFIGESFQPVYSLGYVRVPSSPVF